ncbi:hypothetical protein [Rhodobacter calidifons]|uniref:DUF1127 domain-containing protein n=1 Tax=Rhodobacter calidifons TaxID=2715277 RepID=A0ABX0G6L1_9RHOB|nr:hypothetical protein [Rhodobacter calidifons]NHB76612.1 hypothetical protein [Rhodobacter calidifons]
MLNIFAEALLIAARMDQRTERYLPRREVRRSPREFMEIEGLNTADHLRRTGR